jgi:hypothetical protein
MTQQFIFIFLVFWSLKVIAEKYAIQQKIGVLSMRWKSKLLHEVSECAFCFEHHIAIIPTLLSFLFFNPELIALFTPLMVAGLSNIIKTLSTQDTY